METDATSGSAIDINPHFLTEVLRICDLHVPGAEVWAFGSRAKWTAKPYSDLDIALLTDHPLPLEKEAALREALDNSTLPFRVDFVDWLSITDSFRQIVSRDKVVIRKAAVTRSVASSWPVMPLENALEKLIDYRGKTPEKTTSGVPLITARIVKDGRIETPTEFIAADKYAYWMTRGLPKVGDVVLTTEAPLGEVAQIKAAHVALAQRIVLLRGKAEMLDNTYLCYLLQTPEMQEELAARATGTTVLGIKQSELRQITIRLPPLGLQRSAAVVLARLDDRIALLRETNATLEAIAQALFKSWFVDFDPVRAKQQGLAPAGMDEATAALFPDSFEESALGLVPNGWPVSPLGDQCKLQWGNTTITKKSYLAEGVRAFSAAGQDGYVAIAERSGVGSVISAIGTVGVVHLAYGDWTAIKNTLTAQCHDDEESVWLHFLLKLVRFPSRGSTQQFISQGDARSIAVVCPPIALRRAFGIIALPLIQRLVANREQAQTLAALRDTLLPRLISGQLRLPEAEALTA